MNEKSHNFSNASSITSPDDETEELIDRSLYEDITKNKNCGVLKRILEEGIGSDSPNFGSKCDIKIALFRKYVTIFLEERNVQFFIGEASEEGIVDGIELAVRKMRKGEKCEVILKPEYAFELNGRPECEIPDNISQICLKITLNSFQKVKKSCEMDNSERIDQSILFETKGDKYFKESKFNLAIKQYKHIIKYLTFDGDSEDELTAKIDGHLLTGYSKLAMAYFKDNNYSKAIKNFNNVLEIDSNDEKALFTRGKAYFAQKDYDSAKKDFRSVLELNSDNIVVKNELLLCNNAIKAQLDNENDLLDETKRLKESNDQMNGVIEELKTIIRAKETESTITCLQLRSQIEQQIECLAKTETKQLETLLSFKKDFEDKEFWFENLKSFVETGSLAKKGSKKKNKNRSGSDGKSPKIRKRCQFCDRLNDNKTALQCDNCSKYVCRRHCVQSVLCFNRQTYEGCYQPIEESVEQN